LPKLIKNLKTLPMKTELTKNTLLPPSSTESHVHFIITGGTIDNIDIAKETTSSESKIIPYLNLAIKAYFPHTAEIAFLKDSRNITIEDRELLFQLVLACPHDRIIITHGTYTMAETGRYLKLMFQKHNVEKTAVLVGSMVPMGDENSDAPYNLGFAVAASMILPKGVWVAMQSTAWDPDSVEKDLELHRFKKRFMEVK
jgi:L-asparaginase